MYEMPNDDPEALRRRVRVDYPVRVDRLLGAGELPGVRLQRRFARPPAIRAPEKVLVWAHWIWFMVPHGTVLYVLRPPPRPARARGGADLRDLQPRRRLLLDRPDRAAVVRGAGGPDGGGAGRLGAAPAAA